VIAVLCVLVQDSRSRALSLVPAETGLRDQADPRGGSILLEPGLADVVTLERRRAAAISDGDEQAFFLDTIAEYQWARDIAGLAAHSLENLVRPVVAVCEHYGVPAWRLTQRQVDRYFAGPGKRSRSTVRQNVNAIDAYFAFLEQRYAGEVARRFGVGVESPIDPFNRPRHRGEFGLRIPPSQRAMREFFAAWRASLAGERKAAVACRDYVMAKIAYCSGVRASELCGVRIGEVYWDHGQWGRFLVHGKGSRGSGPRDREAYLFTEGRELLWWYVEEIRGLFSDDPLDLNAPLWPSERLPTAVAALNLGAPTTAVTDSTFRKALARAAGRHLKGPVTNLHPHLLRHACATHNYEAGMTLWEVQKLLGHSWASTTVHYLATAHADPERPNLQSSDRAAQRLVADKGSLR
jgi:integrase/recombinase XerC